jgi:hypothetical protein
MVPTDGVPGGWAGESEHLDPSNPREQGLMLLLSSIIDVGHTSMCPNILIL